MPDLARKTSPRGEKEQRRASWMAPAFELIEAPENVSALRARNPPPLQDHEFIAPEIAGAANVLAALVGSSFDVPPWFRWNACGKVTQTSLNVSKWSARLHQKCVEKVKW